jgi:hypothetical protein
VRPAPTTPNNKYTHIKRLEECEVVAHSALAEVKRAHARLDHQPPQGAPGATGQAGLSIKGDAGRDGKDGKDGVGYAGAVGPQGRAGKDCVCQTAVAEQHIVRLTQKLAESNDTLAAVRKEFADLKLVVTSIHDQNRQADEYMQWLKERAAARRQTQ